MEHGIINATRYDSGVVLCDVQPIRTNTEYENIPMLKPFAGFAVVPAIGQKVALTKLSDGSRFITDVIAREPDEAQPDDLAVGELSIQLDAETRLKFEKSSAGYMVHIDASDSVMVNGVDIGDHVHAYDDETIADTSDGTGTASTSTKNTGPPE